jgi:hypothetical protein
MEVACQITRDEVSVMTRPEAIEAIVLATSTNETKARGKVRKVTFEIPAEGPNPFEGLGGERIHIVVVRLNNDETPAQPTETDEEGRKRRFHEMNPAAQIAMSCQSPSFREFLRAREGYLHDDAHTCDSWVKAVLGIQSKTEVQPGTGAFAKWNEMRGNFEVWLKYERAA